MSKVVREILINAGGGGPIVISSACVPNIITDGRGCGSRVFR